MTLSEELKWRGFINQTTYRDLATLDKQVNKKFYHGYDASVDSLAIGNLAAVMLDKLFIRHGWEPVILAGGATTLIGDPGGKDKERPLQSTQAVEKNVAAVKLQLEKLFGSKVIFENNLNWLKYVKLLDFLRDIGKHFSMTTLVQRDYIARRIGGQGSGISYSEFSYTLLQGYDFLELYKKYGVSLQLAGSDQWGNCLSGVELVRRVTGKEVNALTMPLIINKITGKKFGKSEAGAVWLDENKTSPNDFYQFWLNVDDRSVIDYLKIYTELDKAETETLIEGFKKDKSQRSAQKKLAHDVTKLVHGAKAAQQAEALATGLKSGSSKSSEAKIEAPKDMNIVEALVKSGLASSKTEARQLLASGGVYVNGSQTTKDSFEESDFKDGLLKLRRGKTLKNTVIIKQK